MKLRNPFILGLIFTSIHLFAAENHPVKVFSKERRGGFTDQFFADEERLRAKSLWNPDKTEKPPVSLESAILIARNYLIKKERAESLEFETATLRRMATRGALRDICYYSVQFNLGEFDHPVSIVLMDGTVVEPTKGPSEYDPPK